MSEKRRLSLFWQVGILRALAETFFAAIILTISLILTSDFVQPNVIQQSFLFLNLVCALLCSLRLRWPDHSQLWRRLVREGMAAVALSLMLSVGLLAVVFLLGWGEWLASTNPGVGGFSLVLAASGQTFLVLRTGLWLWRFWDRLRRRRLLWALTHAHLMVVVLAVVLFAILATFQVMLPSPLGSFVPEEGGLAALVVDRIILTIFPLFGVIAVVTVILLAVVLPPSAIFSYFVARRTTRRLEALAAAAKSLRDGDYAARIEVMGEDEVAQLQADFNAMANDLERTVDALQAERDKVASLLQSRRDLMANVSHELRTPVATIRGYLESTLASHDGEPRKLRHDLEVMEREVGHLQMLIEDLFTLSRAEVGELALACEPVDVGAIVQRMVDTVAPLAWRAGRVEVVAQVPLDLPSALADERRLEQALSNLLHNGVRHTPPGGIVAVMATAEQEAVRIEVRDTGEGIPPEDLPHVWERFYRGERARAEDSRGAGLGLALVKELTEAMGGTVKVESVSGQGSCFVVKLPRSET
jgi:signal transduction histidine kinase